MAIDAFELNKKQSEEGKLNRHNDYKTSLTTYKMESDRKVILYIAMSLDGYIAKPDGDLGFLSIVEQPGQDYGYSDFIKTVDTVIMGRKTYDKVISIGDGFPHSDKAAYIITRTPRPDTGSVKFYTDNLKELVVKLKAMQGKNIFVDGGAEIVNELLEDDLIDVFYISIIPVLLGDGIPLFKSGRPEMKLKLIGSKEFEKGLVQLYYARQNK
jgi:dihydrofolate reductase